MSRLRPFCRTPAPAAPLVAALLLLTPAVMMPAHAQAAPAAQQHDVPLFDRFAIMRQWNESGDFDLFSTSHGIDLAKRVHDCLGRALSKFVIDAAHLDPAQQN